MESMLGKSIKDHQLLMVYETLDNIARNSVWRCLLELKHVWYADEEEVESSSVEGASDKGSCEFYTFNCYK